MSALPLEGLNSIWTAKANGILAKVTRARATLNKYASN